MRSIHRHRPALHSLRNALRRRQLTAVGAALALVLVGCGDDDPKSAAKDAQLADAQDVAATDDAGQSDGTADASQYTSEQQAILGVPQTLSLELAGLSDEVQVVRTEGNVAHIYAKNRRDAALAMGFVTAQDRYFQMELSRRYGNGEITELLGDLALEQDIASRASGGRFVAQSILERLGPEETEVFDAFAQGINAYIDGVVAGTQTPPSEMTFATILTGKTAKEFMAPWDKAAVAGATAAIFYNLGYETDDVGRTQRWAKLATMFAGKPLEELRKAGAIAEIARLVTPIDGGGSAAGLGLDLNGKPVASTKPGEVPKNKNSNPKDAALEAFVKEVASAKGLPAAMVERHLRRERSLQRRSGHDMVHGFGSNSWAVMGSKAKDGAALLAGDGHLPLSIPSLFYQLGVDTSVFGGGKTSQMGLFIPGLPVMAVGTNGNVAWSQTQLSGDITDWYRDELQLDDKGKPKATLHKGEWKPVSAVEETYTIANVDLLGSKGRTEKWERFITWDGRWITDVEGEEVKADYAPAAGEMVLNLSGSRIVPKDTDNDGKITAISFDFTGLDKPALISAVDGFGHSKDVWEMRDHSRKLLAYSQNIVAADTSGNVLYTGYQAVPCRTHLPREADGVWKEGANPRLLIDGTQYTGFTIPTKADGSMDESQAADPAKCVVPFDEYPQSVNPTSGYVVTGNQDPGGLTLDGSLFNDKWYIGGPWANGYRAGTIARELKKQADVTGASTDGMAAVQANHESRLGQDWVPFLLDAAKSAEDLKKLDGPLAPHEQRLVDLYDSITPTVRDEALSRLTAWNTAGCPAESGVETFYHKVGAGEVEHAVATTIFNSFMGRLVALSVDDEGVDLWEPWGADARTRTMYWLAKGRGPNNPLQQASWNAETEESAFWDILGTEPIERSREVALLALKQGLDDGQSWWKGAPLAQWIWGMRHGVHFDSLLGQFLDTDMDLSALTDSFSINPDRFPVAEGLTKDDPRKKLSQFPRAGDAFAVDAAGGINSTGYGSGPVFRMVIRLGKDKVDGLNVLPGGQSGIPESPFFDDQAKLWLGNQAMPVRYTVSDVVAGAKGREVLKPKAK